MLSLFLCVWRVLGEGRRGEDCVYVQNAPRVYKQNVSVYAGTTPACGNTCGRGAVTHGDVLNVHMEVFQRVRPHTTPHRTDTHDNDDDDDDNQPAAQFASTRENSPGLDTVRIDRLKALS